MKRLFILIAILSLTGCAAGPVQITHVDGELPKVHVNMPVENVKLRAKHDEITLAYKKRF
jgi:uncharacterized lipoprotein YajG